MPTKKCNFAIAFGSLSSKIRMTVWVRNNRYVGIVKGNGQIPPPPKTHVKQERRVSFIVDVTMSGNKRKRKDQVSLQSRKLGFRLREMGHGSNKKIRKLLRSGSVFVNGMLERSISRKVTEDMLVEVVSNGNSTENKTIVCPTVYVYNKRCGVVTSWRDELGRTDISCAIPEDFDIPGLHCVGRLDQHSAGLLLLTNDGRLTRVLLDPDSKIEREYVCLVIGEVNFENLKTKLKKGVETRFGLFHGELISAEVLLGTDNRKIFFEHRKCMENGVVLRQDGPQKNCSKLSLEHLSLSEIRIRLFEGKKRHIRRMLAYAGHPVINLRRERYGGIHLGNLKEGSMRYATKQENDWIERHVLPLAQKTWGGEG